MPVRLRLQLQAPTPSRSAPAVRAPWLIVAAAILWLAFAAAFGLPGRTLDWGRDLLVFFGQINALEHGQVPYRDFRTSMGTLPFYLPWIGYRLSGGFAGALEIGGLLATALLLPCIVVALRGRFGLPTALVLLLCLTAMAAVPLEQGFRLASHVGFYNRWSYSALTALFLFAVPPRQRGNPYVEGVAVAVLLLFLFFTKMSYFGVGCAFVVGFGAALGLFRHAAYIGATAFAVVVFVVQCATGLIDGYLAELVHSLNVSGASWYKRDRFLLFDLPRSLGYYGVLAIAGIFAVVGKASLCWRHWTFVLYVALACLAIQGHNAEFQIPFALIAPLALLGERTAKTWRLWQSCLLALFILPYLTWAARSAFDYRSDHVSPAQLPRMAGVYVRDISGERVDSGCYRHCLFFVADELEPGLRLLRENAVADSVLGLDYYSYFPALLDVPPLVGRLAVLMPGRTLDHDTAPAPETMFRHAEHVMVPKASTLDRRLLQSLYGEHLRLSYQLLDSNDHWQLWERKP